MPKKKVGSSRRHISNIDVEDVENIRSYLAGDEHGFARLHERYRQKLLNFIGKLIRDRDRAEELVQEAFFRVYRHLDNFDQKKSFYIWLFTIGANLSKNELRNRSRRKTVSYDSFGENADEDRAFDIEDTKLSPERLMNGRLAGETLKAALLLVPSGRRRIFFLQRVEKFTIAEVARIVGCKEGTVKSSASRAAEVMAPFVKAQLAS